MIRTLLLTTALVVPAAPHMALAASHTATQDATNGSTNGAMGGAMAEIPQGVILATSVIGMPTFIKGETATAGPIGTLADAIVGLDGTIRGVVIRTVAGRALAVPAERLEQGRIAGAPVLLIDITREEAEQAPDVSDQLPTSQDGAGADGSMSDDASTGATAGEQSGVTGTTIDGTNAAGADEGSDGTGMEGRAGTDGEPMDAAEDGSSDGSDATRPRPASGDADTDADADTTN